MSAASLGATTVWKPNTPKLEVFGHLEFVGPNPSELGKPWSLAAPELWCPDTQSEDRGLGPKPWFLMGLGPAGPHQIHRGAQIGRASCRERVSVPV